MLVEDIMTKEPVACAAGDEVQHAARLMRDKNVGCVIALEGSQLAGLITDRDIAMAVAEGHVNATVRDVMTTDVARVRPEDNIFHAVDALRGGGTLRRVPVVDQNNQVVGLLSVSDVAVVAERILDAVFLDERQHAREPHLLTGAKRVVRRIRRPTKAEEVADMPLRPVTPATPGKPAKSGRGSA